MRKIALMIDTLGGGGAERVVSNLSFSLEDSNTQVHVIVFNDTKFKYKSGSRIINIRIPSSNNYLVKIRNLILRVNRIKKLKKEYDFDYCISYSPATHIINVLSKVNDKVIVSIRAYSLIDKHLISLVKKLLNKYLLSKADLIISCSKLIESTVIEQYRVPTPVTTIYNPYNISYLQESCMEEVDSEERENFQGRCIVSMGRFTYSKGMWNLVKAFSIVKKTNNDARLVLIGEDYSKGQIQELIKNFGLLDSVTILGFQENPHKYISKCEVYVMPSLNEGFPNALVEAMACGVPVIATDCKSGPREILSSKSMNKIEDIVYAEYGVIIPEFTREEDYSVDKINKVHYLLADCICAFLDNQDLREEYGKRAMKRAYDFSLENITKEYRVIFNDNIQN